MSWRKLGSLVRHLPRDSATYVAAYGPTWSVTDHLLANVFDVLNLANWQRQGRSGAKKPEPIERPGARDKGERIGTAIPLPEMKELAKRWMAGELTEGR